MREREWVCVCMSSCAPAIKTTESCVVALKSSLCTGHLDKMYSESGVCSRKLHLLVNESLFLHWHVSMTGREVWYCWERGVIMSLSLRFLQ